MKDYKIIADSPDILVIAQEHTRNKSMAAPPVVIGVAVTIFLIFFYHVSPWIAIPIVAAVASVVIILGFWLFQGMEAIKIDKATRSLATLTRRWLPPFEKIEYLIPFAQIIHAGIYPHADASKRDYMLGMETKEGIICLIPGLDKPGEQLLPKILAVADHLATVDPKLSQQGREPGHVVTAVEYAPATVATGTEHGSAGFDDVRQDLLDRVDRLITAIHDGGEARGEDRVPAGQDLLEALRAVERKILDLDLKVSVFATSAHAALLHAFVANAKADGKHVPAMLERARYNVLRA